MSVKAVLITGNPKFIKNNPRADKFYLEIQSFLVKLGFDVLVDPGEPYTSPPDAQLWIGHSRGVDRLRFAKKSTLTLAIGSSLRGSINHPLDNTKHITAPSDIIPNKYHYIFTIEMKKKITELYTQLIKG